VTAWLGRKLAGLPLAWRLEGTSRPARSFATLDRVLRGGPALIGGVTASAEPRAAAMAGLAGRLARDGRLRAVRSAEYLEWRFRNPLGQYRYFYQGDGELAGYLVLHARRRQAGMLNPPPVHIVDWEAADDRIREELLQAAIQTSRPRVLQVWSVSCAAATRALLGASGFHSIDPSRGLKYYRPAVLIKSLSAGARGTDDTAERRLRDPEQWDLRMLYSDNY
jgi:hypothetical protein